MNAPDAFASAPDWWLQAPWPLPAPIAEQTEPADSEQEPGYEVDPAGTFKG